mmetsp:Transcript_71579/g.197627  ORF Transcript_71579/g.197627 Transcript_71579/m.197627 type:complete len:220 (-) Transcript_71579:417-1076(-)
MQPRALSVLARFLRARSVAGCSPPRVASEASRRRRSAGSASARWPRAWSVVARFPSACPGAGWVSSPFFVFFHEGLVWRQPLNDLRKAARSPSNGTLALRADEALASSRRQRTAGQQRPDTEGGSMLHTQRSAAKPSAPGGAQAPFKSRRSSALGAQAPFKRSPLAISAAICSAAICAPFTMDSSFAYTISVGTFMAPAAVEKPQSVQAITLPTPTRRA